MFHQAGNYRYERTVMDQDPINEIITTRELRPWRGNQEYDVQELCAFFGLEAVLAPEE